MCPFWLRWLRAAATLFLVRATTPSLRGVLRMLVPKNARTARQTRTGLPFTAPRRTICLSGSPLGRHRNLKLLKTSSGAISKEKVDADRENTRK
jgi:hypothetical protein